MLFCHAIVGVPPIRGVNQRHSDTPQPHLLKKTLNAHANLLYFIANYLRELQDLKVMICSEIISPE